MNTYYKILAAIMAGALSLAALPACQMTVYADSESVSAGEMSAGDYTEPLSDRIVDGGFDNCRVVLVTTEGEAIYYGYNNVKGNPFYTTDSTLFKLDGRGNISASYTFHDDNFRNSSIKQVGNNIAMIYEKNGVNIQLLDNSLKPLKSYNYSKFSKHAQYMDISDKYFVYAKAQRCIYISGLDGKNQRLLFDGLKYEDEQLMINTVAVSGEYVLFGAKSYIGNSNSYYGIIDIKTGDVTVTKNNSIYTVGIYSFGSTMTMGSITNISGTYSINGKVYGKITSDKKIYIWENGEMQTVNTESDNETLSYTMTPGGDLITIDGSGYKYAKKYGDDFMVLRVYKDGKCVKRVGIRCKGFAGMCAVNDHTVIISECYQKDGQNKAYTDMTAEYINVSRIIEF
ncbi:MAG: hypothetical protein K2N72_10010 [Oscillospiraceae bacterium]|nr:hypothetical protein [Oscillospiraceae bacterium]